ncbi:hypothetical protein D9M72_611970 [compost metagenome]
MAGRKHQSFRNAYFAFELYKKPFGNRKSDGKDFLWRKRRMGGRTQFRYLGNDQSGGTIWKRRPVVGLLAIGRRLAEYAHLGTLRFYAGQRIFEKRRISLDERFS